MPTKPKRGQRVTPNDTQERDCVQTPNYATDMVVARLPGSVQLCHIWEPCCGEGRIVNRLRHYGYEVLGTDIRINPKHNCLMFSPSDNYTFIITNPPFSLKGKMARRFIELDKPFAILVPGDWSGWLIAAIREYQCQLLIPSRRINYITPTGKQGKESAAQFHSVWLTRYFNLPQMVTFVELSKEMMLNI